MGSVVSRWSVALCKYGGFRLALFGKSEEHQEHFANLLIAFYPKFRNLHSWCPAFTRLELDCFSDSRHRLSSETSGRMAQAPHYNSLPSVAVHFLGTCSGGGPIRSRNCSSLSVDLGNDIWLFDTADGTLGRLHQSPLKMGNFSKIFITHMHADHVLRLVSVMTTILSGVGMTEGALESLKKAGTNKKVRLSRF